MEPTSTQIKSLILQIISLLEFGDEEYWLSYFKYILTSLEDNSDQEENIRSLRQIFTGGMGSFSDIVLHKNELPLIEENNQLDILKDQLFDVCEEALKRSQKT